MAKRKTKKKTARRSKSKGPILTKAKYKALLAARRKAQDKWLRCDRQCDKKFKYGWKFQRFGKPPRGHDKCTRACKAPFAKLDRQVEIAQYSHSGGNRIHFKGKRTSKPRYSVKAVTRAYDYYRRKYE